MLFESPDSANQNAWRLGDDKANKSNIIFIDIATKLLRQSRCTFLFYTEAISESSF